jgi:hypothetical protein
MQDFILMNFYVISMLPISMWLIRHLGSVKKLRHIVGKQTYLLLILLNAKQVYYTFYKQSSDCQSMTFSIKFTK